jgi:hypothetical protein
VTRESITGVEVVVCENASGKPVRSRLPKMTAARRNVLFVFMEWFVLVDSGASFAKNLEVLVDSADGAESSRFAGA